MPAFCAGFSNGKMNPKIYYIHGLSGSRESATCVGLRERFEGVECLEYPSQTASYAENLRIITSAFYALEEFFKSEKIIVVGTSLGGFFASKLADEIQKRGGVGDVSFLLINPAVCPYETARGKGYERELVDSYKGLTISYNKMFKTRAVVTLDDELLNPRQAIDIFGSACTVFPSGGHSCWNMRQNEISQIIKDMMR